MICSESQAEMDIIIAVATPFRVLSLFQVVFNMTVAIGLTLDNQSIGRYSDVLYFQK